MKDFVQKSKTPKPWSWLHRWLKLKNQKLVVSSEFQIKNFQVFLAFRDVEFFFQILSFELLTPEDIESQLK